MLVVAVTEIACLPILGCGLCQVASSALHDEVARCPAAAAEHELGSEEGKGEGHATC
jgi:hypothetical protein